MMTEKIDSYIERERGGIFFLCVLEQKQPSFFSLFEHREMKALTVL